MKNMIKCEFLNTVIDTGILARRNALNVCINTDQNYDFGKVSSARYFDHTFFK